MPAYEEKTQQLSQSLGIINEAKLCCHRRAANSLVSTVSPRELNFLSTEVFYKEKRLY